AMRTVLEAGCRAAVESLLKGWGFPAERLVLEITENAIAADPFRVRRVIEALSDLGVRLAIDDYGSGYSSLGHLRRLPVHELKIDRSFVTAMAASDAGDAIDRTTTGLAQNLGHRG